MNNNEIMRKYADILKEDEKQINESIQAGICDVVQKRLSKTLGMVEGLSRDLLNDEGSEATVDALRTLIDRLQAALTEVDTVRATYSDSGDMQAPLDYDADYPMADPTGTFK